jgi:hypothetical protein
VDVQITRLRRKIEADPRQPRYLQTVRAKATCWHGPRIRIGSVSTTINRRIP